MKKRALVTGAAGFVGRWLSAALAERGYSVSGLTTELPLELGAYKGAPAYPQDMQWYTGDLRDGDYVKAAVNAAHPAVVIHLAAISHVPTAEADPALAWDVNVSATARLLRALSANEQANEKLPRVLIVGSAEQYGRAARSESVGNASASGTIATTAYSHSAYRETDSLYPRTVYAATKCAQEVLALQQWRSHGLEIVLARSFNHSGPGQEPRFLLPALTARVAQLRDTGGTELQLGNLTPVRDFLHVSDVVDAYISLCERGTPGEVYNVSSGIGRSVREVAECILQRVGIKATLVEDPALVRPVDVPSLVGDSSKLQRAVGWRATKSFDVLIDDLLHAATL